MKNIFNFVYLQIEVANDEQFDAHLQNIE